MVKPIATIFRDLPVDGVPQYDGAGKLLTHKPIKADIREWGAYTESLTQAAQYGNTVWFETKALLDVDLAYDDGSPANVYNDPTPENNGIYIKAGASGAGSWGQIIDYLPGYQFVKASDFGAGTANAIQATTSPRVSLTDGAQLVTLNIFETTTSGTVTVAFDGGTALAIKTASGNNPASGGLIADMTVLGVVDNSGTEFQMLSDQSGAAIQAAAANSLSYAEEWANKQEDSLVSVGAGGNGSSEYSARHWAAKAAVSGGGSSGSSSLATRTALKALTATAGLTVLLTEAGREGTFIFKNGDYAANIAADTAEGIYIKANAIAANVGAWVRIYDGPVLITWFGASPTNLNNTAVYNVAIAVLADGQTISWPKMSGIWSGHFDATPGRSFVLDGGGNSFEERPADGNVPIVRMSGSVALATTLTANTAYGDRTLSIADTSGLSADDVIYLEDGAVRPSDNVKVNQEILKIKSVDSGTIVTVYDKVRSIQSTGTKNVYLVTPISNAIIKNFVITGNDPLDITNSSGTYSGDGARIDYAINSEIRDCVSSNLYGAGVQMRYVFDCLIKNNTVENGSDIASGGYGLSFLVGRKLGVYNTYVRNCRNVIDFDACYDYEVVGAEGDEVRYGIPIAHNRYGGGAKLDRIKIRKITSAHGIFHANQAIANPVDYILRDIDISNVEISFLNNPSVSGFYGVYLQTSIANVHVDDVSVEWASGGTPASGASAMRVDGQIYGTHTVNNIRSTRCGFVLWYELGASPSLSEAVHLAEISSLHLGSGNGVVYARGCKHLSSQWLTMNNSPGLGIKTVGTAQGVANVTNESIGLHAVIS